jgi:hypothetical protein
MIEMVHPGTSENPRIFPKGMAPDRAFEIVDAFDSLWRWRTDNQQKRFCGIIPAFRMLYFGWYFSACSRMPCIGNPRELEELDGYSNLRCGNVNVLRHKQPTQGYRVSTAAILAVW